MYILFYMSNIMRKLQAKKTLRILIIFTYFKNLLRQTYWAVIVAHMEERFHPTWEPSGSNPATNSTMFLNDQRKSLAFIFAQILYMTVPWN